MMPALENPNADAWTPKESTPAQLAIKQIQYTILNSRYLSDVRLGLIFWGGFQYNPAYLVKMQNLETLRTPNLFKSSNIV